MFAQISFSEIKAHKAEVFSKTRWIADKINESESIFLKFVRAFKLWFNMTKNNNFTAMVIDYNILQF